MMGTSTAGIAHAAIVGHLMGLPMGYVRSSGKDHGRQNRIEGKLEPGQRANLTVFDLDAAYMVDPGQFQSMGRATPFAGMELYGVCRLTIADGVIVWREDKA